MHESLRAKMTLDGRTAVVTRGGGRIGRGIAIGLGDLIAERAAEVAAAIAADGGSAVAVTMDAMESDQMRALVAEADRCFGALDVLVNNVGGTSHYRRARRWRHLSLVRLDAQSHGGLDPSPRISSLAWGRDVGPAFTPPGRPRPAKHRLARAET